MDVSFWGFHNTSNPTVRVSKDSCRCSSETSMMHFFFKFLLGRSIHTTRRTMNDQRVRTSCNSNHTWELPFKLKGVSLTDSFISSLSHNHDKSRQNISTSFLANYRFLFKISPQLTDAPCTIFYFCESYWTALQMKVKRKGQLKLILTCIWRTRTKKRLRFVIDEEVHIFEQR